MSGFQQLKKLVTLICIIPKQPENRLVVCSLVSNAVSNALFRQIHKQFSTIFMCTGQPSTQREIEKTGLYNGI